MIYEFDFSESSLKEMARNFNKKPMNKDFVQKRVWNNENLVAI